MFKRIVFPAMYSLAKKGIIDVAKRTPLNLKRTEEQCLAWDCLCIFFFS